MHPHNTVSTPSHGHELPPSPNLTAPNITATSIPHGPDPPPTSPRDRQQTCNQARSVSSAEATDDYVTIVVSYDIACQWSVHLWERIKAYPERLQVDHKNKVFIFLVPKFHLPAHVEKCQTSYSFNLTVGVGRTDGEAPERGWSFINPLSSSTKEMGPASYRETIDDHFGDWNHKKVIGLGSLLIRRIRVAVAGRDDHVVDFYQFTDSLPATSVLGWTDEVEQWEKDNTRTNPFVPMTKKVTQHGVRLALAQEDEANLAQDNVSMVHEEISPGVLVAQGLELETQLIRLKTDCKALDASATLLQLAKIQERKTGARRKINAWISVQLLYMPEVAPLRAAADRAASRSSSTVEAYDIPLYLPSSLPSHIRVRRQLYEYEFRLRRAQAYEALDSMRGHLRLRTHMYHVKDKHIRGQAANTRTNNLLTKTQKKVNASATQGRRNSLVLTAIHNLALLYESPGRYDEAKSMDTRNAMKTLALITGDVGWEVSLQELQDSDIRAFTDDTEGWTQVERMRREKKSKGKKGLGEGVKKLSWIWMVTGVEWNGEDQGLQETLRIQWCKARARAMRWSEEVLILREEMQRTLTFFGWHADWWDSQAHRRFDLSPEVAEGLAAYAFKQAGIRRSLRSSFDQLWRQGWHSITHGVGADNAVLNLPSSHIITRYPESP